MLTHTFCHIPGVGPKTESRLWSAGVHTWQAVQDGAALPLQPEKAKRLKAHTREALKRLSARNLRYFYDRLPSNQHWRLFPDFRDSVAYLDIETTGLGDPGDHITTIVVYDGRDLFHYVHGQNLHEFADRIAGYDLLVTYNGKCFDVPFIRTCLGAAMDQAHIDLRYVLADLGYRGGLKGCEKKLGMDRGELADVDGYFAVLLWGDYRRRKNAKALETLLAYNAQDVVNLETLMVLAYNQHLRHTPFSKTHTLPLPTSPEIPFVPHPPTIQRIRRTRGW